MIDFPILCAICAIPQAIVEIGHNICPFMLLIHFLMQWIYFHALEHGNHAKFLKSLMGSAYHSYIQCLPIVNCNVKNKLKIKKRWLKVTVSTNVIREISLCCSFFHSKKNMGLKITTRERLDEIIIRYMQMKRLIKFNKQDKESQDSSW